MARLAGILVSLLLPIAALARSPASVKLAPAPVPLLARHLAIQLPQGAKLHARQASIMAAEEPDSDETRAFFDLDKVRLVVMAHELHALVGSDFAQGARADLAAHLPGSTVEPLDVAQPLRALAVKTPAPSWDGEANLVFAAYLAHPDGTAQFLAFYVGPGGKRDAAAWTDLARRVAASATAGERRAPPAGGERRFDELRATLPPGWAATKQEGPDFTVVRLHPVVELGKQGGVCGVYLGGHPGYQWKQAELPADKVTRAPGKLLGADVEWATWTKDRTTTVEAMAAYPKQQGLMVHAFCSAATAAELGPLRDVVQTLAAE